MRVLFSVEYVFCLFVVKAKTQLKALMLHICSKLRQETDFLASILPYRKILIHRDGMSAFDSSGKRNLAWLVSFKLHL